MCVCLCVHNYTLSRRLKEHTTVDPTAALFVLRDGGRAGLHSVRRDVFICASIQESGSACIVRYLGEA